ncbi:hypothetical protein CCAN2_450001 [Capnocytophaga canimorsus]|nr:hypothetical protein CCAN2_450001 [Capnocytophaga canimorsus]
MPDYEDVDGNYTMNTENSYYEYRLPINLTYNLPILTSMIFVTYRWKP